MRPPNLSPVAAVSVQFVPNSSISIIFRAFQGVGASGIYSMIMALSPELVPEKEYGKYIAVISTVFLVASVLGPILGGAINTHTTWRWVFLLK